MAPVAAFIVGFVLYDILAKAGWKARSSNTRGEDSHEPSRSRVERGRWQYQLRVKQGCTTDVRSSDRKTPSPCSAAGHRPGAVYLAGYGVECILEGDGTVGPDSRLRG